MPTVHTIGHSTRPLEEFLGLLEEAGIKTLADIRTVPGSRRNPQYNQEALRESLRAAGIGYIHLKGLGGLRKATGGTQNEGWRNAAFRNYADYMQTPEFESALLSLMELAQDKPTAILCAEAVPWRCHRSLVGDALTARGVDVLDIMGPGKAVPHRMTPFAVVSGHQVTYPREQGDEGQR